MAPFKVGKMHQLLPLKLIKKFDHICFVMTKGEYHLTKRYAVLIELKELVS